MPARNGENNRGDFGGAAGGFVRHDHSDRARDVISRSTETELADVYGRYIDCLNAQDWRRLGDFVHDDAVHNGRPLGLSGYRGMIEESFRTIPDLRFVVDLLVCQSPHVAARLWFDCTPTEPFLGVDLGGRRVSFAENVFYRFRDGRIAEVWSVLDKAAIEAQIR